MLSVQNYSFSAATPKFRGENSKPQDQNQKPQTAPKAFETHAGLKTGAVYGGITAAMLGLTSSFAKFGEKAAAEIAKETPDAATEIANSAKQMKNVGKGMLMYAPIYFLAALGCGAVVDKIINNKNAQFAERVQKEGKEEVLKSDDHADKLRQGGVYYRADEGKKYGAALGAVVLPALNVAHSLLTKTKVKPVGLAIGAVEGALGGLMLGAITDSFANKGARRFADKNS